MIRQALTVTRWRCDLPRSSSATKQESVYSKAGLVQINCGQPFLLKAVARIRHNSCRNFKSRKRLRLCCWRNVTNTASCIDMYVPELMGLELYWKLPFRNRDFLHVIILLSLLSLAHSKVEVLHYGQYGGLSIVCQRDELILVESEKLGYSSTSDCSPHSMCSVEYTLVRWYCRGKSTCTGMQVERRPLHKRTCGSDFTNCLRVEYRCVKRK